MTAVMNIHVLKPGDEADDILRSVSVCLERPGLRADEHGVVRIVFAGESATKAYEQVRDALDRADKNWADYILFREPPGLAKEQR